MDPPAGFEPALPARQVSLTPWTTAACDPLPELHRCVLRDERLLTGWRLCRRSLSPHNAKRGWWAIGDSNPEPGGYEPPTLPVELIALICPTGIAPAPTKRSLFYGRRLVRGDRAVRRVAGAAGFEPARQGVKVPCLSTWLRPHIVSNRNCAGAAVHGRSPFYGLGLIGWRREKTLGWTGIEPVSAQVSRRASVAPPSHAPSFRRAWLFIASFCRTPAGSHLHSSPAFPSGAAASLVSI